MRIFIALTYYRPHYSGLTIYTERLARSLAERGHQVTVLTSRFNNNLLKREVCNGVEVIRADVMMRVSKGVLMPELPFLAWNRVRQADVVNLHVPQLDASYLAMMAKLFSKPVVLTYHCDLQLPTGTIHKVANQVSHLANHLSARLADRIVTNTQDYAEHSPFLRHYLGKVHPIPPPIVLPRASTETVCAFRQKYNLTPGEKVIGIAARLATEKGVEYLIEAMPSVLQRFPTTKVLFVGQHENVLGEEPYAERLQPLIQKLGGHWRFLGVVSSEELAAFYEVSDVTVLPSINGTESFGMVQVEAMTCGTPAVATDMPGVRQPVRTTGMGRIVPTRDSGALAEAIIDILDHPDRYHGDAAAVTQRYSPQTIASEYEEIFQELTQTK
ncbi:MAG TPA: glycosyltransferase family 4 protein [Anaerolineaceae bacterium]|nr:glycosyltransferase family 4 protein [Anaerolineaceae bacterium]